MDMINTGETAMDPFLQEDAFSCIAVMIMTSCIEVTIMKINMGFSFRALIR
jgi:hypothetical protein